MKKALLIIALLIAGGLIGAAGVRVWQNPPQWLAGSGSSTKKKQDNGTTVKYVGPMHPQIVRDEPGKCPICGMELVPKVVDTGADKAGKRTDSQANTASASGKKEREILYWVAPMDPSYRRDKPGKSPMGMDLVPVYADEVAAKPGTITIDPSVVLNLGIETTKVRRMDLSRTFRTVGEVTYNERLVSHIHTRVKGWVEHLYLEAPGDQVRKGAPILEIYSPELVTTQQEYLLALRRKKMLDQRSREGLGGPADLVQQARERLRFFGISSQEIEKIARTGKFQPTIMLRAPHSGIVTELGVREGMRVTPEKMLYTVADLSSVWVMAHIYASQAEWVKQGDEVILSLPFFPGRTWKGEVEYVYPYMMEKTRTVQARLVFDNPDGYLKPNMFATARIHSDPKENVLAVPDKAVIRTGKRSIVVLSLGQGRFRPVEVTTGIESGNWVEIKSGLTVDMRVVTSSQFLLDAESDLQAGLQRLSSEKPREKMDMNATHQDSGRQGVDKNSSEQVQEGGNHQMD